MIAPHALLKLLYDKYQDCLSTDGNSYKEQDSSTQIIHKKKVPDIPTNMLILYYRCNFHMKVSHFQMTLCQADKKVNNLINFYFPKMIHSYKYTSWNLDIDIWTIICNLKNTSVKIHIESYCWTLTIYSYQNTFNQIVVQ